MDLKELANYLDGYLETSTFSDASVNGLQVEDSGSIKRIGMAVDACLESVLLAARNTGNTLLDFEGHGMGNRRGGKGILDIEEGPTFHGQGHFHSTCHGDCHFP